ncbi:hypothetical protein LWC34_13565 [Kibdelosporangium philippinense]|uniref:Small secreted protein n=1 Tax=Kibdelosporangium philippinense TaxID=211113 RepID=A0ABS8Z9Q1_9PSEU|nr:hypothetical protein [Kibdelosporangium philippinense]MCE7003849.1 hypothetical protein [Kibdelosporangium philippinense]
MRRLIAVPALVTALVLTACNGGGQQQPAGPNPAPNTNTPAAAPNPAQIDFADDVCDAVAEFVVPAAGARPDTSSPAAAVNSYKVQLAKVSDGLRDATEGLNDVNPAAIPDGQATVDDLRATFAQMKQAVDTNKAKLDAVDMTNQKAMTTAVQEVNKEMVNLAASKNPLSQPALNTPQMEQAAAQAPECQKIKQVVANRTTTAPPPTS